MLDVLYCDNYCHCFVATAPVENSLIVSQTAVRKCVMQSRALPVAVGGFSGHADFSESIPCPDQPQEYTQ